MKICKWCGKPLSGWRRAWLWASHCKRCAADDKVAPFMYEFPYRTRILEKG